MSERIKILADKVHAEAYKIYLYRLDNEFAGDVIFYNIFNELLAQAVAEECAQICMSQADRKNIRNAFELPVANNVKYVGPEPKNSIESQYNRKLNTTKIS